MRILGEILEAIFVVVLVLLYFLLMFIYEVATCWRYLLPKRHWLRQRVEFNIDL
jgi:hypothetical protein